jgi:hypothetical protein
VRVVGAHHPWCASLVCACESFGGAPTAQYTRSATPLVRKRLAPSSAKDSRRTRVRSAPQPAGTSTRARLAVTQDRLCRPSRLRQRSSSRSALVATHNTRGYPSDSARQRQTAPDSARQRQTAPDSARQHPREARRRGAGVTRLRGATPPRDPPRRCSPRCAPGRWRVAWRAR